MECGGRRRNTTTTTFQGACTICVTERVSLGRRTTFYLKILETRLSCYPRFFQHGTQPKQVSLQTELLYRPCVMRMRSLERHVTSQQINSREINTIKQGFINGLHNNGDCLTELDYDW